MTVIHSYLWITAMFRYIHHLFSVFGMQKSNKEEKKYIIYKFIGIRIKLFLGQLNSFIFYIKTAKNKYTHVYECLQFNMWKNIFLFFFFSVVCRRTLYLLWWCSWKGWWVNDFLYSVIQISFWPAFVCGIDICSAYIG